MSVIDVLRLLFSQEARNTLGDLLKLVRKSPEWKKDLVVVKEKFSITQQTETDLLIEFVCGMLSAKQWEDEQIGSVHFVLTELVQNAFEHGIRGDDKGKVTLDLCLSSNYLKSTISDTGKGFDLDEMLNRQATQRPEPGSTRALTFIKKIVSSMQQTSNPSSICIVINREQKACVVEKQGRFDIYRFKGSAIPSGYYWASIIEQIRETDPDRSVVLEFSSVERFATRRLSELEIVLMKHRMKRLAVDDDDVLDSMGELESDRSVALVGIQGLPHVIREYFIERFAVYEDVETAMMSLQQGN